MGKFTEDKPKCLINVNKTTILENALINLEKNGIKETAIVVGYLKDKIIENIGNIFGNMKITYIESKDYDKTNNMYSLWHAKEILKDGAILIEGDCFFEERILKKILEMPLSSWAVDNFKFHNNGCMLLSDRDNIIQNLEIVRTKPEKIEDKMYKSAGMLKITPDLGTKFAEWLDEEVKKGNTTIYYDLVLQKYLKEHPIHVCNIQGLKWVEIDDSEDLKKAEELFLE